MEVTSNISRSFLAAIAMVLVTAALPAGCAAHVQTSAPAPSPASDGTTIDQGIAYVLMLVALVLTYIIH
ncbi:Arabinogalactan protein 22 [Dorcoceras hygrometricum]|uniref:Arabinogalactan protein 22 n=1 Tax=Dorcoceras hygrometricum TaxID=472368 RepID=A0A2Z7BHC3_9LAMI|nr:Arabinogalactan protein 22 [Dorcoceras hygrometricum]